MALSFHWFIALAMIVVCFLVIPCSSSTCRLACVQADNTFIYTLPHDESYANFSAWVEGPGVLTEGVTVQSEWVAQDTASPNIYFDDPRPDAQCYLNITFVVKSAGNRNRMGVFEFDREAPLGSRVLNETLQVIFPDITTDVYNADGFDGPCLPQGSTVELGPFAPNASVGFFLDPNGRCVDDYQRLWSIDDENLKYDTTNWNAVAKPYGRMASILRVQPQFTLCCPRSLTQCALSLCNRIPLQAIPS
jgi:hypothetical protein